MCGNGVPTGMERILQQHKPTQQVLQQVLTTLFVAAAGTTLPSFAVQLIAASSPRTASTAAFSGFVCLSPRSFNELKVGKFV